MAGTLGTMRAAVPATMGEMLCAFAYASDLAVGLQLDDSLRACYVATRTAEALGLPDDERADTYYAALLKDAGCTAWTTELAAVWQTDEIVARRELIIHGRHTNLRAFVGWARTFVARDRALPGKLARYVRVLTTARAVIAEAIATSTAVSRRVAGRLGMPERVGEAVYNVFERWDGARAPRGLRGEDIPRISRVVLPTFFLVPCHSLGGREASVQVAQTLRGSAFDPAVIDAARWPPRPSGPGRRSRQWHRGILHLGGETMTHTQQFTVLIEREGDWYVSLCPEFDIASQGRTVEEARCAVIQALEAFFETAAPSEVLERHRSEVYITQVDVT